MGAGTDIMNELAAMRAQLTRIETLLSARPAAAPQPSVAGDADLDGQYGDPEVKKNPPRWTGTPEAPRRMSECSPEFLAELASFHDWRVGVAEDDKKRGYAAKDAARARGWRARILAGWKPPEPPGDGSTDGWG